MFIRVDKCEDAVRFDGLPSFEEITEVYKTGQCVMDDAERYYHENFCHDDDYEEDFKSADFCHAIHFWEANDYEIYKVTKLNFLLPTDSEQQPPAIDNNI